MKLPRVVDLVLDALLRLDIDRGKGWLRQRVSIPRPRISGVWVFTILKAKQPAMYCHQWPTLTSILVVTLGD